MAETPEEAAAIEHPGQVPAAPTSPLAGLRASRQKVIDELYIDLVVPRYEPTVYVRFRPISDLRMQEINKQAEKSKDPEKNVVANAVALAHCCIGIFADADTPPSTWPKFDDDLAEILGLPGGSSTTSIVRSLYATDGDLLAVSGKVAEWSGYSLSGVEERAGN